MASRRAVPFYPAATAPASDDRGFRVELPLDIDTLAASVRKTRRLLVVDHGHYTNGFGSHVIAEMVQAVPGIKARKIAFPDVPGPGAKGMMAWLRPDAPKIVDAAMQLIKA